MKLIMSFLFLSLPIFLAATNYTIGDKLNVVAINGLFLRSQPNTKGDKLTLLKTGEKVTILNTFEFKENQDSIFGFKGNWVQIETKENLVGYVFDAFLSTLPMAKSLTETGRPLPNNSFEYSEKLYWLLEKYVDENFSKSGCAFEYNNNIDGGCSHEMIIEKLNEGHDLIKHRGYESMGVEVKFKKVRNSEIYYLVHQFLKDTNHKLIKIEDFKLKNLKSIKDLQNCVAKLYDGPGCVIYLIKDSEDNFSLTFNAPCC